MRARRYQKQFSRDKCHVIAIHLMSKTTYSLRLELANKNTVKERHYGLDALKGGCERLMIDR